MQNQQVRRCRLQGSNLHQGLGIARCDSDRLTDRRPVPGRSVPVILTAAGIVATLSLQCPARGGIPELLDEACTPIARPLTGGELEERAKLQLLIQERHRLEEKRVREILCRLRVLGVDYQ